VSNIVRIHAAIFVIEQNQITLAIRLLQIINTLNMPSVVSQPVERIVDPAKFTNRLFLTA
jgi:hypothetical protein